MRIILPVPCTMELGVEVGAGGFLNFRKNVRNLGPWDSCHRLVGPVLHLLLWSSS